MSPSKSDQNTTLCLTCSSSLPPYKNLSNQPGVFITPCCRRPICSSCITANPRLARYDPCLACLGGVDAVCSHSTPVSGSVPRMNVDGAMRDEDIFVLEDEEDDENTESESMESGGQSSKMLRLSPVPAPRSQGEISSTSEELLTPTQDRDSTPAQLPPLKYYITRSDTLQGIVLRHGLDGLDLCRINNLPPSTLKTTPHLLHTRHYIILPPSARNIENLQRNETAEEEKERKVKRSREKATKQLQKVAKEVDWQVAKTYVALAEDPTEEEMEEWARKRKETSIVRPSGLGERAIEQYLDDDGWESEQKKRSDKAGVPRAGAVSCKRGKGSNYPWWRWGNDKL